MKRSKFQAPPPHTPPTPTTSVDSTITSLQSLISHHYLNALKPNTTSNHSSSKSAFSSRSFIKNSNKKNISKGFQSKANSSANNQKLRNNCSTPIINTHEPANKRVTPSYGFSSSLSHDSNLTAKSLSDFRLSSCGSSSQFNLKQSKYKSKANNLPNYIFEGRNSSVNCKTDIHNRIIGNFLFFC